MRIKAKNVDIDADHFQQVTLNGFHIFFWNKRNKNFLQMVASLWSALPLEERAKYERKAEQNLQHGQDIQNVQKVQNMQNTDRQNYGREVEEEWRVGQDGAKLDESGLEGFEGNGQSEHNLQINNIAEQETAKGEKEDIFCSEKSEPVSSLATGINAVSSTAEENSLDLIGDSQPYSIFYNELRQVIGW